MRSLSNSSPSPLDRALRAYRRLNLALPAQKRPTRAVKRAKRLNSTEVVRLVERYSSGGTVYELATEFGVHRTTVSEHLKAVGVQMRRQPLTPVQVRNAARLYASGLSLVDVGRHLGVHASTVNLALRERGVLMRKPWDHLRQHKAAPHHPLTE